MDFGFSPQDQAFRKEVVAFLDKEVTPDIVAELAPGWGPGPLTKAFYRKMGAKGWLTVSWPKKYGGLEGTHTQRLILSDELSYRRVSYAMVGASMAGPTILLFGSDETKEEFLPRISRSEIDFALGYTEPDAGSDLASLDIRAVEDGDDYVVNGQKIFNTDTHFSDYHWLGARTDPTAPKHKGVSLFCVDLKSPGIEIRPLITLSGMRTNVVYYDNVRVPKKNLVGQKNRGFYHIATALDFERIFPTGGLRRSFEDLVEYTKVTKRDGKLLCENPLVRQRLAEAAIDVEASWLLSYRVGWMIDHETVPNYQASMLKLYGTEAEERFGIAAQQILGLPGEIRKGSKYAVNGGEYAVGYLSGFIGTIVAGTSEVQRNIIATRGLGLPRG